MNSGETLINTLRVSSILKLESKSKHKCIGYESINISEVLGKIIFCKITKLGSKE